MGVVSREKKTPRSTDTPDAAAVAGQLAEVLTADVLTGPPAVAAAVAALGLNLDDDDEVRALAVRALRSCASSPLAAKAGGMPADVAGLAAEFLAVARALAGREVIPQPIVESVRRALNDVLASDVLVDPAAAALVVADVLRLDEGAAGRGLVVRVLCRDAWRERAAELLAVARNLVDVEATADVEFTGADVKAVALLLQREGR